jgi:hypothetical protein
LNGASPSSACIGATLAGSGRGSPLGARRSIGSRSAGMTFICATVMLESTERSCTVRSALDTKRSLCLMRSQFFSSLVRTSA